ncbi:hypothetical protein [Hymenobacter convexus]|uniref:hypothetical protein n=1 Tax=Hymenobacter sp. CA1UV-4 TaxID=3063782 RepID=UPI002713867E|nr:hypothetical protein [Hymenobacter sp. CA1UV-4]MDO7851914.1 hypothetical protein [Hymenobacter sp. CA1UV-4]
MNYFGVEIFDGIPQKDLCLEEGVSLEDQWFHLTQDVTCIKYSIHGVLEFYLDVGWYPDTEITPESGFKIEVMEALITDGGIFYRKEAGTVAEMKQCLAEAATLIYSFNELTISKILQKACNS